MPLSLDAVWSRPPGACAPSTRFCSFCKLAPGALAPRAQTNSCAISPSSTLTSRLLSSGSCRRCPPYDRFRIMNSRPPSGRRLTAILQGLFIAFLWATSWVLIKFGLKEIPPLVFAGVRYFLAFLILLVVFLVTSRRSPPISLPRRMWGRVIIFGLLLYTVAQGAMFVALNYLPAVTLNLILNFNNLGAALLGAIWLAERPTWLQWAGITLALIGALIYFLPANIPQAQWIGVLAALVCR